ncbi:MAG TPA: hypothetical protein ENN80_06425 [Candidatus Hydrogenedentes bacterium]|nr:hypothetical protein [Candidatus Hydrogenedentota bacterium]
MFDSAGVDVRQHLASEAALALYAAAVTADRRAWPEDPEALVDEYVAKLRKNALLAEEAEVQQALRAADEKRDYALCAELMAKKKDLWKKIEAVGAV